MACRPRGGHCARCAGRGTGGLRRRGVGKALARLARPPQPRPSRRRAGRRLPQADPAGRGRAGNAQPRLPPHVGGWGDGGVPRCRGRNPRRPGPRHRLRQPRPQRLAGGQPVHRGGEPAGAAARCGAVRQRPSPGSRRTQEPRGRERHGLGRLAAVADLQGRPAHPVLHERGAHGLGRDPGAHGHVDRGAGVVQALAHGLGRDPGRPAPARAPGPVGGRLCARAVPRPAPRLHRVRGRRQRRAGEEDGRLPPVPRGADRGGRDPARGRVATGSVRVGRRSGPLRVGPAAGRRSGRPAHRRGVAHPGVGQEPDHGLLCRARRPRTGHAQPHGGGAHRPQRPGRPALRHVLALRRPAAPAARAGGEPGRPARQAGGGVRRRGVHHHPEVLPRRERRPASAAFRPAQRGGHRRRGAPEPVRLHRRLCAPHARRPAPRLVHRFHRHPHRACGRQHPRGVRRPHQRVRRPARGAGQGDGAHLLREPPRPAGPRRGRAAKHRPRLRGSHRRRGDRPQGKAQDPVGATRGRGRRREAAEARCPGRGGPLRGPHRGHGRQGHGGVHEPAHLHGPLPRARAPAPGLALRRRRRGQPQGGDDRRRVRPAGLAAPHPQQAPARGPGETVPGPRRPVAHGAGARHVAHRLRRPEPPHHVRGQAHARPRPDAGHRPGQPRVPGQARRLGGGLPGARPRAQARPGYLHRDRRRRGRHAGPGAGGEGDAGEVRSLLRPVPRVRPGRVGPGRSGGTAGPAARGPGARARPGERQGTLPQGGAGVVASLCAGRAPP